MKKITLLYLVLSVIVFVAVACEALLPAAPADDALLDGPIAELTPEQNALFALGDAAFNRDIFTPATGLGPIFVASSCGSCHAGDG